MGAGLISQLLLLLEDQQKEGKWNWAYGWPILSQCRGKYSHVNCCCCQNSQCFGYRFLALIVSFHTQEEPCYWIKSGVGLIRALQLQRGMQGGR